MNYNNEIVEQTRKDKIFAIVVLIFCWWLFLLLYFVFLYMIKLKVKNRKNNCLKKKKLTNL